MSQKRKQLYILSLIQIVMSCSSSCPPINYEDICPVYPVAGEKVASELYAIPYDNYENLWEWLARINKLKQELDICLIN